MHLLPCPFCQFSDSDEYFLAQHVETVHPESGQPSFVARHFLEPMKVDQEHHEEGARLRDAPSRDYIECECGEAVALSEFDDHVQLHSAESADMAADTAELLGGDKSSVLRVSSVRPPSFGTVDVDPKPTSLDGAFSLDNRHPIELSKARHKSRGIGKKHQYGVKEWVDLLLGASSSNSLAKHDRAKNKRAKRLGVSYLFMAMFKTEMYTREPSLVRLPTKSTCLDGCINSLNEAQKPL